MASKLAQRLVIAWLLVALCGAPVLGSLPNCCSKGCCRFQKTATATKSCCAKVVKSCCAHKAALAASSNAGSVKSNCCCKARAPMPAVPEKLVNSELRFGEFVGLNDRVEGIIGGLPSATVAADATDFERDTGPSRQILLCRWLV